MLHHINVKIKMLTENLVKAFVGNLEIIGNGIVHSNGEQMLNLVFENLEMSFEFSSDDENKETRTSYRVEENKWIWELTNYTEPLGVGVISPFETGTLRDRKLYVSFFIWTPNIKENRRIINYVLYLEKEV